MSTKRTARNIDKIQEITRFEIGDIEFEATPDARITANVPRTLDGVEYRELILQTPEGERNILVHAAPDAWGRADLFYADYILTQIRVSNGLHPGDLAGAFVTSGIDPGLQLLAQVPHATPFSGTIMLTKAREFLYVVDDEEE